LKNSEKDLKNTELQLHRKRQQQTKTEPSETGEEHIAVLVQKLVCSCFKFSLPLDFFYLFHCLGCFRIHLDDVAAGRVNHRRQRTSWGML